MADVAGWAMPLSYRGAMVECRDVRTRAGIFDISHLGRIRIRGDGAMELLERLCTADVAGQEDDTAVYTLLCNERGGIIDHAFLLRLGNFWLLTCSAINRAKVLGHLEAYCGEYDARVDDQTARTVMLAVSGPAAAEMLDAVLPQRVSELPHMSLRTGSLMIARYVVMRVGYTGQWSLEVIMPNMVAGQAWDFITKKASRNAMPPVGLSARDVLRIEAGLYRYGHEINETIDPVTAGLAAAVDFEHDFLGREAVSAIREKGPARRLAGLVLLQNNGSDETLIPRQGASVYDADGHEAGTVTSGTYSPTLEKVIALGYVAPDAAERGTRLLVEIGAERVAAEIIKPPFYPPRTAQTGK